MGTIKKKSLKSLSAGRPPMAKASRTMSRKASRTLINKHHQLEKQLRRAAEQGDSGQQRLLKEEIEKLGGLDKYQKASLQGQSHDRGGDTSKILMQWLPLSQIPQLTRKPRMLEVGALSTTNACSVSGLFDMVHIDLNSQEPGITQQDFMERPLPTEEGERFDIISLSLVINFVPNAADRGRMLARTLSFLKGGASSPPPISSTTTATTATTNVFPSLFLVLPRSCIDNSRYFTDTRLEELMSTLGYSKIEAKLTQKLAYSLWKRGTPESMRPKSFQKEELNPGKTRNNFVITLDRSASAAVA